MRIVFMGTPEIAQVALSVLLSESTDARPLEVVGVYTRPDKPVGRRQVITPPPVKLRASENNIPVYQPATLRNAEEVEILKCLNPDLIVVVAYGMILPPEVLAVPRLGCVNLHVSMLPKYRGAAPIQWAVINGETETGVTIMQLDEGLDTGPILTQQKIDIPPEATAGDMFELVTGIGARLLADTVLDLFEGKVQPRPQQGEPSHAPQLDKTMAQIDFNRSAGEINNLVRGCNPWPLAWFESGGKRVKLLRTRIGDACGEPGMILSLKPLTVGFGNDGDTGSLIFENVHPEGSRPMTGEEWAAGRRFAVGQDIGE